MKKNKIKSLGFTLIELLMVIAIIAILSAIILAALSAAKGKGNDAAVKSQLKSAMTQAELYYYSAGNTYCQSATVDANCTTQNTVCDSSPTAEGVKSMKYILAAALKNAGLSDPSDVPPGILINYNSSYGIAGSFTKVTCHSKVTAWAAEVPLKDGTSVWCIDSTGVSALKTTNIAASSLKCP